MSELILLQKTMVTTLSVWVSMDCGFEAFKEKKNWRLVFRTAVERSMFLLTVYINFWLWV